MLRGGGARRVVAVLVVGLAASGCVTSSSGSGNKPAEEPAPAAALEVQTQAALVAVDDSVEPDPDVVDFLAPRAATVEARANRVVGTLSGPLPRGKPESPMGSWASDAMREGTGRLIGQTLDVCFTNAGGLRRDLEAGEITEGMLVEVMPFDNSVVVFTATSEVMQQIVDRLAERGDPVSGLSYRRTEEGAKDVTVGGAPLGEKASYRVCTNDYVFAGGGGYPFEEVTEVSNTGVLVRDVFIQEFERRHAEGDAIDPPPKGRVTE